MFPSAEEGKCSDRSGFLREGGASLALILSSPVVVSVLARQEGMAATVGRGPTVCQDAQGGLSPGFSVLNPAWEEALG